MYAVGLSLSAAASLPFFRLGALDVGIPIQAFGVIVAIGVLIGAGLLRRYAEWHGVDDDYIRGLTGWVTVTGFIGAHVFDVLAYQWADFVEDPMLIFYVWKGISSYGGFVGGIGGWFFYVWWKRRPMRLFADIGIVGLLPAFSIGRIGCTVVSDHIGAAIDPTKWYAVLGMDYPRNLNLGNLAKHYPGTSEHITAWNLGLVEFIYLVPVNLLVLWLAFRSSKRPNAGTITVLTGMLYAPVRFVMEFLRPEDSDPRYLGMTFAQWCSIVAFAASFAFLLKILKDGKPAEPVTKTSGEAQAKLKMILKDDPQESDPKKPAGKDTTPVAKKNAKLAVTVPEDDDELAKEVLAAGKATTDTDKSKK
jgi:phosphatidylglycerol---prolipoprotein diacylglyceryl transferase